VAVADLLQLGTTVVAVAVYLGRLPLFLEGEVEQVEFLLDLQVVTVTFQALVRKAVVVALVEWL
jgi:hypothetical protein